MEGIRVKPQITRDVPRTVENVGRGPRELDFVVIKGPKSKVKDRGGFELKDARYNTEYTV